MEQVTCGGGARGAGLRKEASRAIGKRAAAKCEAAKGWEGARSRAAREGSARGEGQHRSEKGHVKGEEHGVWEPHADGAQPQNHLCVRPEFRRTYIKDEEGLKKERKREKKEIEKWSAEQRKREKEGKSERDKEAVRSGGNCNVAVVGPVFIVCPAAENGTSISLYREKCVVFLMVLGYDT